MIEYRLIGDFLAYQAIFVSLGILGPALLMQWTGRTVPGLTLAHSVAAIVVLGGGLGLAALHGGAFDLLRPPNLPLSVHPETIGIEFWGLGLAATFYALALRLLLWPLARRRWALARQLSAVKLAFCVFGYFLLNKGWAMLMAGPDLAIFSDPSFGFNGSGRLALDAQAPAETFWHGLPTIVGIVGLVAPILGALSLAQDQPYARAFFAKS